MTETLGERVLERARRRKLALEAEKPRLHLEESADEVQPDPIIDPQIQISAAPKSAGLTLEKVLEVFPAAGPLKWTPNKPEKASA